MLTTQMRGRPRQTAWMLAVAGVVVTALGSSCSSTPGPSQAVVPVTKLINANAADTSTYTLRGPLSQVTAVYGILRVEGPGEVTITAISAHVSTSRETWWETETNSGYIATVHGSLEQSTGFSFESGGDLPSALQHFTPRLSPWDKAVHATRANLRAGAYYLLATVFDIPSDPAWALLGADVTYRVGGSPHHLLLSGLEVQVQTPLAS